MSSDVFGGKGFIKDETYTAITTGARGTIFEVIVTRVNNEGAIMDLVFKEPGCDSDRSTNLNNGELFNVIWSSKNGQSSTDGSSAVNIGAVIIGESKPWDFGFPINPIIYRAEIDPDVNIPLARMQEYYRQKQIVKYKLNINDGEPCTYKSMPEGSTLYIGRALDKITVVMESGKQVDFYNVPAGNFLPILVLTVVSAVVSDLEKGENNNTVARTTILSLT
jgi:hypothetical protein